MLTSSCKAKGRKLQQLVAKSLYETFVALFPDLSQDDIKSVGMGQSGVDVVLSPLARKYIPLAIECKARESINTTKTFEDHFAKYANTNDIKLLIQRRNRGEALAVLRWSDLLIILSRAQGKK